MRPESQVRCKKTKNETKLDLGFAWPVLLSNVRLIISRNKISFSYGYSQMQLLDKCCSVPQSPSRNVSACLVAGQSIRLGWHSFEPGRILSLEIILMYVSSQDQNGRSFGLLM